MESLQEVTSYPPFWGPPTSSIDWCEDNYTTSPYIAEFLNTISNALFVVLGALGVRHCLKQGFDKLITMQFAIIMCIGFGSAAFHGSLTYIGQQLDETPMVWCILIGTYLLYAQDMKDHEWVRTASVYFLTFYGILFAVVHAVMQTTTSFQVHFLVLSVLSLARMISLYNRTKLRDAKRILHRFIGAGLVGFAFWLMDLHMCPLMKSLPINPHGHVWWHLFMAYHAYSGAAFAMAVLAEEKGEEPYVQWWYELPFVYRKAQKHAH